MLITIHLLFVFNTMSLESATAPRVVLGGALVKMPKNKFLPILMILGDLVGIAFIKMSLNFCIKILSRKMVKLE